MPRRSNCLLWALAKRHVDGGRITWRWSHNARWLPHFIWTDGIDRLSYSPIQPRRFPWDCPWFRGRVGQE